MKDVQEKKEEKRKGSKAVSALKSLFVFFILILILKSTVLISEVTETSSLSRIQSHLLLKDFFEARTEAEKSLLLHPNSLRFQEWLIKIFARLGFEESMFHFWKDYTQKNPDALMKHDVLEEMAWGVIEKGQRSSSPIIRAVSLLASFLNNDIRGVNVIHASLQDSNSFVRSIAAQLVGNLHDQKLKELVWERFKKERRWSVRLEVIKSIGKMKIPDSYLALKKMITNEICSSEEKRAAIESIIDMMETATRDEIEPLAYSPRSGLRLLACAVVGQLDLNEHVDLMIHLLEDRISEVRKGALSAIALLHLKEFKGQPINETIASLLNDLEPEVSILAARLLIILEDSRGVDVLKKWLNHERREYRLMASGALASTGKYGCPLMIETFNYTDDLLVKLNVAIGLIGQRQLCDEASSSIYQIFLSDKGKWMWQQGNIFRYIAPSTVRHKDEIPQYPEVVNQITRLEIIQLLAYLNFPQVDEAIKQFFREKPFGITGIASALLLTEGGEDSSASVRSLLSDPDPKVRIQAALILAMWGREDSVINVLQDQYLGCDREIQERILEALGRVGSHHSIPFLVERLDESSQQLRIMAASSLLQCLYK